MKIHHWLAASGGFMALAFFAAWILFTALPLFGATLSIFFTSILFVFRPLRVKTYLTINFAIVVAFTIVGHWAAANDLRDSTYFSWMFDGIGTPMALIIPAVAIAILVFYFKRVT